MRQCWAQHFARIHVEFLFIFILGQVKVRIASHQLQVGSLSNVCAQVPWTNEKIFNSLEIFTI
jgi:hypothetical protein